MPIKFDDSSSNISDVYFDGVKMEKVYFDDVLVYTAVIYIDVPSAVNVTYDGKSHYGCAAGTGYTRSGTGTNAGSYTTTLTLKSGYMWSDGTSGTKTISWKINKAEFTKVEARLKSGTRNYVQWRINGPNCAAGKTFKITWKLYNTNTAVTQPRDSGTNESFTASDNGNLVCTTATYNNKATSDYKYYGTWTFEGTTNFKAFSVSLSKSNAKTIKRQTSSADNYTTLINI